MSGSLPMPGPNPRPSLTSLATLPLVATPLAAALAAALALLLLVAPAPAVADGATTATASDDAARLHALFERAWEEGLERNPLAATGVGRHEYDHRLPSFTMEALDEGAESLRRQLAELDTIDRSKLSRRDRNSYDMFRRGLELGLAGHELGLYQMPITAEAGFHTGFAFLPREMPLDTVDSYEDYITRLHSWPRLVEERIALMRQGLERGLTPPRVTLEGFESTIAAHVVDDPTESVFWPPFETFPSSVPEAERERLREAGRKAIEGGAVAGYRAFLEFMTEEYLPNTRETIGISEVEGGDAIYALAIRNYTTLELTPEEIHAIGLAEVERIDREMRSVIEEVGFEGDFEAFLDFLRTDPRFYAETPEDLLMHASWIAKRMDGELPKLFHRLPRQPYTVSPVPDHLAPKYTAGRYVGAPPGSTQPGRYWVNTHRLDQRPLYNLEALTLHEAVPGHHLQIALTKELEDLPTFRRHSYISAFGEGWGLYSERLGLEVGFYEDPYSNFGRLTYEMWRACRLVVDTGLHAMGWSRQQAMDYLAAHTALPLHEVETETDRYISWPGQALAYKLGEIEIRRLRARAEERLGTDFDVRDFHDVVLREGSVPLGVLADNVESWIDRSLEETSREERTAASP